MANGESSGIWKASTVCLAGVVLTLVACIWNMDRDRATKQDLVPIGKTVVSTEAKVDGLSTELSYLKGQLRARKLLDP